MVEFHKNVGVEDLKGIMFEHSTFTPKQMHHAQLIGYVWIEDLPRLGSIEYCQPT